MQVEQSASLSPSLTPSETSSARQGEGDATSLRSRIGQILEDLIAGGTADRMTPYRFVDQVEHEFKTPLTSIRSLSEILRDNPDLPEKMREQYLRIVLSESARLEAVVAVLLQGLSDQNLMNRPGDMQDVLSRMAVAAEDARRQDQAA